MENEWLRIFDEHKNPIGVAGRGEVHRIGYWHETFHCWFFSREAGKVHLHLQLRSTEKKDYPNLLDITAAGHLLATESVQDGIREVKEEIGSDVSFDELMSLGIVKYCVEREGFIDKELAHVFLHECTGDWDAFTLQQEEVAGMVKVDLDEFRKLWMGEQSEVNIYGFKEEEAGKRITIDKNVGKEAFVPHGESIYLDVLELIEKNL